MAKTDKKSKALSTSRKTTAPKAARGEAAATKPAAPNNGTEKTTQKAGMADLITMPAPAPAPSSEQIAELARKYWAERGYAEGHQEDDWFRAEQELRAKAS
jgi:hypothetical protein